MLDEILAMCWILEPSVPLSVMALHTSSRILAKKRCPPIKLACASEEELEDWVHIDNVPRIICTGGHFKNTYELFNLRALKNFPLWIKSTSFNAWVRYFLWNFKDTLWNSTQNIFPIHWKIWFLNNIEILRALRFKSSYEFLKRPPVHNFLGFVVI